jgi:hypothetical protein
MAVKLNVHANVTGQQQLLRLNAGLKSLGNQSLIAKRKLQALEVGAARAKATMSGLGTALKVGVVAGFAAAGFAAASFVRGTIQAGNLVEKSRIQFNAFFGDVKQGGQAFQILNKYAATVPFTLDKIISGGTALAAISDGPLELGKNLELVGNLAATANISFQDAALQYQRVASAGVAAADLLRDKGVTGLLGFVAGAQYSAEESVKVFEETFLNGGRFSKVANDLAGTLEGNVSMVEDFYFKIKATAAKPLFEGLTQQVRDLVGDFKENDAELKKLAKRIGESLAVGFGNLGKLIKFVVDNFDKLVKGIKLFLGLKIFGFVNGVGGAFLLWAGKIKTVRRAFIALNLTMKANPIGLIVLAIEGLVLGFIIFEDKIKDIVSGALKNFNENLKHIQINFLKFKNLLNWGDEDVNLAAIQTLEDEVRNLSNRWDEAAEAKFAYLNGSSNRFDDETKKLQNRKNYVQPYNPRGDMRGEELARIKASQAKELAEANKTRFRRTSGLGTLGEQGGSNPELDRIKKVADAQNRAWAEQRGQIQKDSILKGDANRRALEAIRQQREALSEIGIDSKSIATTIGDTWVNGIRAGNSLLQITKDSFKNILATIAETMLRKSIEYGVELLFQALLGKKVDKEKQVTSEKRKQLMYATLTAAVGGGGGGFSFFGMAKGGVVPGGAPYTDRVPTMLTPGEVVIPRDKVGQQSGNTSITNINISGNVDQRSIDQIKGVISSASAEVGGANKAYTKNTQGVRGRNI